VLAGFKRSPHTPRLPRHASHAKCLSVPETSCTRADLLIDRVAGADDRCPILPGNARRSEALHEQFGESMHRHRWMICKRQIAHCAQESPPTGIKVCLSHLGKLGLPDGMSPLSTLTTLDSHNRWPLLLLNTWPDCIRPNRSSNPMTSCVDQVSPRSRRDSRRVPISV
jgi:hypothetical protein